MTLQTENAKVRGFFIGIEDHGTPGIAVRCGGNSWTQSYGIFSLRGMDFASALERLLAVLGTDEIANATGRFVRIEREDGMIRRLRHITDDVTLDIREFYTKENQ